ncbi:hypothetical protein FGIG_00413 [Fasciola gigantica]|uniref:Cadherin domain-containing protein n=1 Tax=Fasciola gigantica TaxID=46835 RepID=A0A504YFG7_FASGI|nr:hypothetical protein FGIG_00413 [Fasciola gigantica]
MDLICYWCLLLYTGIVFHPCGVRTTSTRGQSTEVIELHTTVQEEQPVGQVIMRLAEEIEQHDKNLQRMFHASSENKRFHLLPTHDASLFHINTDGSLLIAKRLDYEELCDSARLAKYTTTQTRHPGGHDSLPKSSHSLCHLSVRVLILQAAPTVPGKIPGDKESGGNTGGRQRQLRTVIITINLVDANDNRPTCALNRQRKVDTSAYSGSDWIEVPENTPIGTVIASWKLSDRDTVPNGITDARLLGTKNGKSALLTVGELPFRLQFDDTAGPWSTVKLKLILIKSVEYTNQQPNNRDSSDEMDVYSLKVFILDSKDPNTGSLWNSATIATTPGAHCHLQVSIVDVNDHNPVWVSPINFINGQTLEMELAESKSYIQRDLIRLKATDGDRGLNARISYQWAHRNDFNFTRDSSGVSTDSYQDLVYRLFYLDAATGSLQLRGSNVDFESISRFHPRRSDSSLAPGRLPITLHVVAVDQPLNRSEQRFSPVGTIIIWLLDVNDHSPRIQIIGLYSSTDVSELPFAISSSPIYPQVVYVAENLPSNDPVAFITVTDEDSEAHGGIACSLNQVTFDRTQPENPAFQLIEVTQQTMSELPNDHILPEIIDTTDASRSANYKMITTKSLDRELVATYQLNLSCIDSLISAIPNPITRLTSYRTIEVIVTDRNDNQPHIVGVIDRITGKLNTSTSTNGAFMCSVREHAIVGTKICQLRADDLDQTGHTVIGSKGFSWWLEDSVRSLVDIERETGWLVVQPQAHAQPSRQQTNTEFTARSEVGSPSSLLDREVLTELSFTVYVHDSPRTSGDSRLTASANILLRITDINDHVPKISEYNYFQISEGASPGTLIGNLVALDGDEPDSPNSALTYHIHTPRDGADNMIVAQKRELPASTRVSSDTVANELRDIKKTPLLFQNVLTIRL